ncbi:MAG: hypothetical protein GY909_07330 [Oligoflexia bacterium]|nr:hypothetical protein [Oligoflexia bacterium]
MKLFKVFTVVMLLSAATITSAFSSDNAHKGKMREENFAKFKAMAIESIDKKIAQMQKNKSCISSASKREDLKACRKAAKEAQKQFKEERQKRRREWKEKRKNSKKQD